MLKKIKLFCFTLVSLALAANNAFALQSNHDYTVQLRSVSGTGQQALVDEMAASTDINGKLNFQFNNVPDAGSTPFLMIQIMDGVTMVRQSMVPSPTAGQQMQMGVSEISHSQTRAALQAMAASGSSAATMQAMFPLTMIETGAMSDVDAETIGLVANDAATGFEDFLTNSGTTNTQMMNYQNQVLSAMRAYAADNKTAVDDIVLGAAAGHFGIANANLMTAMMQAGDVAGIDPVLLAAAFNHAGQTMDNSAALNSLPTDAVAAMQATFMAGAQQRQMSSQVSDYALAMPIVGASPSQTLDLTTAMHTLQDAMTAAQQTYSQQAFADPTTLPDQTTIDAALNTMQMSMQSAFDTFTLDTTADLTQIDAMLGTMASNMNSMGGMMGGGMMSGAALSGMNLGMMQTTVGGALQNWSTMMVAVTNLLPSLTAMNYISSTTELTTQLSALSPASMPTPPDMSALPDGPAKNLLQLHYDLMLVHLIDVQMAANLAPLDQADMADISSADLANRNMILQGMTGLTDAQSKALVDALSPMHLI